MATNEFWNRVPLNEEAERATRGFFERDTFAIWVEDGSDVEIGENLILLSTRFHEHFHFAQSVMTSYGRESQWIAEQRVGLLVRILEWFQKNRSDGLIPFPIKQWLAGESMNNKTVNEFNMQFHFLDMHDKTLDGFPTLTIDLLARAYRDKQVVPVIMLIDDDNSMLPVPLGGIIIAENWAHLAQEIFLVGLCHGKGLSFREFEKLFDQIRIGVEGETKESRIMRFARYKSVSSYLNDTFRLKNWEWLFGFLADKALMIPPMEVFKKPEEFWESHKDYKIVFPGYRYKVLFSVTQQHIDSLKKLIAGKDYDKMDKAISKLLDWPTNTEVTSQMLEYLPGIKSHIDTPFDTPILQDLYIRGFKLRMSDPSILVAQPYRYKVLLEELPVPVTYTRDGWVGFSGAYDEVQRDGLILTYDVQKLTRALLYGEPLQCFYPQCESRDLCNWRDALGGKRGTPCGLEWSAKEQIGIDLSRLKAWDA